MGLCLEEADGHKEAVANNGVQPEVDRASGLTLVVGVVAGLISLDDGGAGLGSLSYILINTSVSLSK